MNDFKKKIFFAFSVCCRHLRSCCLFGQAWGRGREILVSSPPPPFSHLSLSHRCPPPPRLLLWGSAPGAPGVLSSGPTALGLTLVGHGISKFPAADQLGSTFSQRMLIYQWNSRFRKAPGEGRSFYATSSLLLGLWP